MKFRRHVPHRPDWTRPLHQALDRARKLWRSPRFLRAGSGPGFGLASRIAGGKAVWVWLASAIGAFGLGYLIAALVLFPAPIFAATTAVPRLIGLSQEDAEESLRQQGLTVGDVQAERHPTAARGDVVWQDPPPGVGVPRTHTVDLVVSGGPQQVPVPDLTGYDASIAEQLILAAGLIVGRQETTQAPVPAGVVINTRPPAGATLMPGTEITLVVSVGAPTITVPDLQGLMRDEADSVLGATGLTLGTTMRRTTSDGMPGTVIAQNPAPGTLSAPGTAVNVTLARRRSP